MIESLRTKQIAFFRFATLCGFFRGSADEVQKVSVQTPRQNVYACARLSISGLFFSHTFQSDQSLPRALGFILCCSVAARVFDYFAVIEIAFMDNQAQITETISRLDSDKNRRKAIFNWAAKGLFFLKGGGGYTHSGYHKTLSATIACDRTSCETET